MATKNSMTLLWQNNLPDDRSILGKCTTMPGTKFLIKLKGFNFNKRILYETTNILKRKTGVHCFN